MLRRLQALVLATVLVVAAFSTGHPFLFYLLYLGILVDRRLVRPRPPRPDAISKPATPSASSTATSETGCA